MRARQLLTVAGALATGAFLGALSVRPAAADYPTRPVSAQLIQGVRVAPTAPTNGQCLIFSSAAGRYNPTACGGGGGGQPLTLGTGLVGGSYDGSAPVTASVSYGSSAGTACQGNDARLLPAPSGAGKVPIDTGSAYSAAAAGTSSQLLHGGATPAFAAIAGSELPATITSTTAIAPTSASPVTLTGNAAAANPQTVLDSVAFVSGGNVAVALKTAGNLYMGLTVGSGAGINFYNPGGPYAGAINAMNSSGSKLLYFDFAQVYPYTDNTTNLGGYGASYRWKSVWSYQYAHKQQATISSSGAITIDPTAGETVRVVATGNITSITVNAGIEGQALVVFLVQNAGGTATWPTTIVNGKLPGGSFTKTAAANAVDMIRLYWDTATSAWFGVPTLNFS